MLMYFHLSAYTYHLPYKCRHKCQGSRFVSMSLFINNRSMSIIILFVNSTRVTFIVLIIVPANMSLYRHLIRFIAVSFHRI